MPCRFTTGSDGRCRCTPERRLIRGLIFTWPVDPISREPRPSQWCAPMSGGVERWRGPAAEMSVVVCTHNRMSFLRGALDGLLHQTLPVGSVDIIVVDDGSTDDTAALVASYGERVRYSYQRQAGL